MESSSSLYEMFDGLLTFMHCIHDETTHQAFMEEFTRHPIGVSKVKLISIMCTKYAAHAAQLVLKQLELAQKLKYVHEDGGQEDSSTTVSYKDKMYPVKIDKRVCT